MGRGQARVFCREWAMIWNVLERCHGLPAIARYLACCWLGWVARIAGGGRGLVGRLSGQAAARRVEGRLELGGFVGWVVGRGECPAVGAGACALQGGLAFVGLLVCAPSSAWAWNGWRMFALGI